MIYSGNLTGMELRRLLLFHDDFHFPDLPVSMGTDYRYTVFVLQDIHLQCSSPY